MALSLDLIRRKIASFSPDRTPYLSEIQDELKAGQSEVSIDAVDGKYLTIDYEAYGVWYMPEWVEIIRNPRAKLRIWHNSEDIQAGYTDLDVTSAVAGSIGPGSFNIRVEAKISRPFRKRYLQKDWENYWLNGRLEDYDRILDGHFKGRLSVYYEYRSDEFETFDGFFFIPKTSERTYKILKTTQRASQKSKKNQRGSQLTLQKRRSKKRSRKAPQRKRRRA
tara:strand:+ start:1182 stop:1847 length:666 start_codon:yes stop_codon:yes gene_type:complete